MNTVLTHLISITPEMEQAELAQSTFHPQRSEIFNQAAIAHVHRCMRDELRGFLEMSVPNTTNLEDLLLEWDYIATGQGTSEGLADCKYLHELDSARIIVARTRGLDPESSWLDIISSDLDLYTDSIELGLRNGLSWDAILMDAYEVKRKLHCEKLGLNSNADHEEIISALERQKMEQMTELERHRKMYSEVMEECRVRLGLPAGTPQKEVEKRLKAHALRIKIQVAQEQNLPPDDLTS